MKTTKKRPTFVDLVKREAAITKISNAKQARLKAALDRETMIDTAHLLNAFRFERENTDRPLSKQEEETRNLGESSDSLPLHGAYSNS